MQGSLERAIGQTLCDSRERERGVKALNQNHFQAQICKTKTLDSLSLTSGFSCRVFPLFLGCKGIWWRVSPSCHFFELSPALQERQREPRHSWAKYLCCHKSNYCFELRLLLPFPFSRRIEILLLCCKPSKTLCGRLLWAAQIQSCTRQAEFFCNAAVCIPAFPFLIKASSSQTWAAEKSTCNVFSASSGKQSFCLASFLLYLKT